jgi:fermentation-respiration switch protein FrsA (DUF1100 family)
MPISWIYLIILFCFLVILTYFFYPRIENLLIFYPEAHFDFLPSDWSLTCEDVYFDTKDNTRLHGWFFPLKGEAPVILFCHGNAGNISHRLENIKLLLDEGMQVFIFDYRGFGKSGGKPSETGLYMDGLAAYDFLVNQNRIPPDRVVPFGRSLGASVAIEISLKRSVRSLIIESPFTSTKEMAKTIFLFNAFAFLLPPHYNNLEKINRVTVPKLIIHGENDEIVPFSMGEKLYQTSRPPKYFLPIKQATHNDTYLVGGKRYFETLSGFINDKKL